MSSGTGTSALRQHATRQVPSQCSCHPVCSSSSSCNQTEIQSAISSSVGKKDVTFIFYILMWIQVSKEKYEFKLNSPHSCIPWEASGQRRLLRLSPLSSCWGCNYSGKGKVSWDGVVLFSYSHLQQSSISVTKTKSSEFIFNSGHEDTLPLTAYQLMLALQRRKMERIAAKCEGAAWITFPTLQWQLRHFRAL